MYAVASFAMVRACRQLVQGSLIRMLVAVFVIGSSLSLAAARAEAVTGVTFNAGSPDGSNGWYRTAPAPTITASDPAGVAELSFVWQDCNPSCVAIGSPTVKQYTAPYPTTVTESAPAQPQPGQLSLSATATNGTGTPTSASTALKWDPDGPSVPANLHWSSPSTQGLDSPTVINGTSVCAYWALATDAVSGMQDYRIQLAETPDFSAVLTDWHRPYPSGDASCFTVEAEHSYYFRVQGRDLAGNPGAWSGPSPRVAVTDQTTGPAIAHAPVTAGFVATEVPLSWTATCGAGDACSARLFYRTTPIRGADNVTADDWTRVVATQTGSTVLNGEEARGWSAAIPAGAVTTTGVDYFIEAERNFALTQEPGSSFVGVGNGSLSTGVSPVAHSFFHVNVVSPPLVTHSAPPFARSGEALALDLQATCSAPECSATVYFRATTDAVTAQPLLAVPDWPRAAMSPDPGPTVLGDAGRLFTFRSEIPAEYVDTRGVDYFFSVTDGTTTTWWPGTSYQGYYAPVDGMRTGYQHVHVLETPHVVHVSPESSPYRQPVPIDAQATCSSGACTAALYYRTTTSSALDTTAAFTTVPMAVTPAIGADGMVVAAIHGEIPAAAADTRGVDYFFSVSDGATTTWWPGTSSVDGYVPVPGVRVGYEHVRILDPPRFYDVPPATAPALQPLTVDAPVSCATESCTVTLHYTGSTTAFDGPFTAVPMTKVQPGTATPAGELATWRGVIPAAAVTTRGVSYYLAAFDGYTRAYSPGTSYWGAYVPTDGVRTAVHPVRVLEPPHLVHAPVATAYFGQPIRIEAQSNCATATCAGTLHWRTTGHAWQSRPMTTAVPVPGTAVGAVWSYQATIPAADVTTEGVDYRVEVNDSYVTDATPTYHVTVQAPTAVLHVPVVEAAPARDIPIEALVPCSTGSCTVTVSYRQTGDGLVSEPAWTTVAMQPVGTGVVLGQTSTVTRYGAAIPADAVTVRGVDYYVRANDGFTTAYSPGSAYVATQAAQVDGTRVHYFTIHVSEPIRYVHQPVATAAAGDPIRIVTQANCSTPACSGTLSYRATTGLATVAGLTKHPCFGGHPRRRRLLLPPHRRGDQRLVPRHLLRGRRRIGGRHPGGVAARGGHRGARHRVDRRPCVDRP